MSEAETLFGEEHVRRYRETGGEVGHRWKRGSKILLLTTKGRKSGEPRTKPLIYEEDGDNYVIVASRGGAPEHPDWYRNLEQEPNVELQVLDEVFPARARTAEGEERERLWQLVNQQWPDYDSYQTRTDREIPVVVLERASSLSRSASAGERARRLAVGADPAEEVRDGHAGRVRLERECPCARHGGDERADRLQVFRAAARDRGCVKHLLPE